VLPERRVEQSSPMRFRAPILLFLATCLGAATAVRAAVVEVETDTPSATVASLQRGLIAVATEHPSASIDERFSLLKPIVESTHDLAFVAEFVLRRQWSMLDAEDRARFVAAFERLSVMTYAARFTGVGPDTFAPIEANDPGPSGRAEVSTAVIRANDDDVSLDYLLQHDPSGWRIVNIVADGVSDLALKRAEYQRVLANGTLDTLITELETQTERLREK
jgi:phospholipid transport system substrate-binding protein